MPFVTITSRGPRTPAFRTAVGDSIQQALVGVGVPQTDRFQRFLELDADAFRHDERYPDLERARGADFVLIEVLWSVGRSVKVKRAFLADLVARLAASAGLDPEQVMVVFKETAWENWSFGGARLLHA